MMEKQIEKKQELELIKSGQNFLGILNDIKRRPEDAAKELGVPFKEIHDIIEGKKAISHEIIEKAAKIWPINERDFYIINDDCQTGIKIMTAEESEKTARIMERAGKPYYEYHDTAMSSVAPFRPEWIMELCYVDDNNPNNSEIQWNNGHFMHQFTYFIGDVNFYYKGPRGSEQVAIMNTGDSMYITPFVPHTFATRNGAKKNGLILALTYGGKLTGDTQQELSSLSTTLGSNFALDFSSKDKASASLFKYHMEIANMTLDEISSRTNIQISKIEEYELGKTIPPIEDLTKIANALTINLRDLLPNDKIENKVIVKKYQDCRKWYYPKKTKAYQFVELASSTALPFSKAFEIHVLNSENDVLDLQIGLHQFVYNVGNNEIELNWTCDGVEYHKILKPRSSAYIKPFINHNFRGNGKLLVLRIGGKIAGESQRELSFLGKENVIRAIAETMQWFDPKGKN